MRISNYPKTIIAPKLVGSATMSADGSTVVYSRHKDGKAELCRTRNGELEVLATNPRRGFEDISVSADGEVVAWAKFDLETRTRNQFRWLNGKVEGIERPASVGLSDVSADGSAIVFTDRGSTSEENFRLHRWTKDGLETIRTSRETIYSPKVNADGSEILWKYFTGDGSYDNRDFDIKGWSESDGSVNTVLDTPAHIHAWGVSSDFKTIHYTESSKGQDRMAVHSLENDENTPVEGVDGIVERSFHRASESGTLTWTGLPEDKVGTRYDRNLYLQKPGQEPEMLFADQGYDVEWAQLSDNGETMLVSQVGGERRQRSLALVDLAAT